MNNNVKQDNNEIDVNELGKMFDKVKDLILNSEHYSGRIETIDFINDKLTKEQYIGYLKGNILKYLSRCEKKGSTKEDLLKGFYILFVVSTWC